MIRHDLPGQGPDAGWFDRLNAFEQQETKRQVRFKTDRLRITGHGPLPTRPEHHYPHILPADTGLQAVFYGPIASQICAYCDSEGIQLHSQVLNLRSSQVCCFNVMFPLRLDHELARAALAPVLPGATSIKSIEFEYTGPGAATEMMGEPASGKRGQNRTSIDCAIEWEDGSGRRLTLVEWKYTEKTFGDCGGYHSKGNGDKQLCRDLDVTGPEPAKHCYLVRKHSRQYWRWLEAAGVDLQALSCVRGCPFRGPFYQLVRQYVLAACLRQLMPDTRIDVAYVGFRDSCGILDVPRELRVLGDSVLDAWNAVVREPLRHVCAEDIALAVRAAGNTGQQGWLDYLAERYGI